MLALAALVLPSSAGAADPRPFTVPAVRSFSPSGGTCRVPAHPAKVRLAHLRRNHGPEGYELVLRGPKRIVVRARTSAGRFYGRQTLLALRGQTVPCGVVTDRPAYRERGMMIDVGRRFYPRKWLIERIAELGRLKLNLLHLHLSDDQGFRVASRSHPEIVSEQHLTVADVRALQAAAERNHVTIVPEIDMPGHMTAALAKHPELQLTDALGNRQADKLDVTLPAARTFVAELLADQLELWNGPFWHGGADEYLGAFSTEADYARYPQLAAFAREKYGPDAGARDAVQDFVNTVGAQVRAAGKRLRVWSDGMNAGGKVTLPTTATVEWWENRVSPPPQELAAAGYGVLNVGWWPLYYVNGGPFTSLRSTEADFYEEWDPWHFEGPYTARWGGGPPDYD
jgi:hexosaminidase